MTVEFVPEIWMTVDFMPEVSELYLYTWKKPGDDDKLLCTWSYSYSQWS